VLDPFCGSGTTCVSTKLLKRNFIGIDISHDAVELAIPDHKNDNF
jgi:site-specific DNA-methyltransferase (adenine-specific)